MIKDTFQDNASKLFNKLLQKLVSRDTKLKEDLTRRAKVCMYANAEFKAHLSTAINATDARAVDVKYDLACHFIHFIHSF